MEAYNLLLGRIEKALGPAAATMFHEKGSDRHLIGELTFSVVALYVLGKFLEKFLDGVIEGLEVKELGKKLGKNVTEAVRFAYAVLQAEREPEPVEIAHYAEAMSMTIDVLKDHKSSPRALERGLGELRVLLVDQGIPESEAEIISLRIVSAIWQD